MEKINDTLSSRQNVHGDFSENAAYAQQFKNIIKESRNFSILSPVQKESLDLIVHKIARILAGDVNHADHWHDIAGYATLVEIRLEQEVDEPIEKKQIHHIQVTSKE